MRPTFSREKAISQSDCSPIHAMPTLLYRRLQINAKIRYGNLAHAGDGCRQQLCIENCGQTATARLVTIDIYSK